MINREYSESVKNLMPGRDREGDLDRPVSLWKELDRIRGFPEQTTVVIFRTRGCSWYNFSSCSMCGYFNDVSSKVSEENLLKQVDHMVDSLNGSRVLKVFTSGSFLDPVEIPVSVRNYFYESIRGRVDEVLVESRTEYLNEKNLSGLNSYGVQSRIAIGLESANDYIMKNSVNKGSNFSKYLSAVKSIKSLGLELRTYLLFKPPFLSEIQAMEDILDSIRKISDFSNDVSVNPMNIQKNTMVEHLWKRGLYRPPRLWSIAKILLESRGLGTQVVSYPTGGNRERGAHNDRHDQKLLDLIFSASLNQEFGELEEYFNNADKSGYLNELQAEHVNLFQPDYGKLISRISSSSIVI